MNEELILATFDSLVQSGLVHYDDKQETIQHIDGDLMVSEFSALKGSNSHSTLLKTE